MVGVSKSTVHDVTTSVFQDRKTAPQPIDSSMPLRIGKDGKRYPSTKTKRVLALQFDHRVGHCRHLNQLFSRNGRSLN